jgi:hypothetical protein
LLLLPPVRLTLHTMLVMEGVGFLISRMMVALRALAGFFRPNIVFNNHRVLLKAGSRGCQKAN